jgi:hypothetical protein
MTFPKPCARLLIGVAMLGITALSTGCSLGVEPWERDLLARESMKMDGHIDDAIASISVRKHRPAAAGLAVVVVVATDGQPGRVLILIEDDLDQ